MAYALSSIDGGMQQAPATSGNFYERMGPQGVSYVDPRGNALSASELYTQGMTGGDSNWTTTETVNPGWNFAGYENSQGQIKETNPVLTAADNPWLSAAGAGSVSTADSGGFDQFLANVAPMLAIGAAGAFIAAPAFAAAAGSLGGSAGAGAVADASGFADAGGLTGAAAQGAVADAGGLADAGGIAEGAGNIAPQVGGYTAGDTSLLGADVANPADVIDVTGAPSSVLPGTNAGITPADLASGADPNLGLGVDYGGTGITPTQAAAAGASGGASSLIPGISNNALVGAAGNLGAAAIKSNAAGNAATNISNAANTTGATSEAVLNQQLSLLKPWFDTGKKALGQLSAGTDSGGQFNKPYTLADFESGPQSGLYTFAEKQAQEAENAALNRSGQGTTTNAVTGAGQLAADTAAQYYNTGFNENLTQNNQTLQALENQAGLGQNATNNAVSSTGTEGTNLNNGTTAAGNAAAAAQVASATPWANALTNTLNSAITQNTLSSIFA